jgi:hypothetical protein
MKAPARAQRSITLAAQLLCSSTEVGASAFMRRSDPPQADRGSDDFPTFCGFSRGFFPWPVV